MIPVLVLLALLSGCALVDGAADLTNRAVAGAAGRETTPVGDPLSFHLQLALLSDRVVTQIVQEAETPLDAVDDPNRRAALLRLRLGYAFNERICPRRGPLDRPITARPIRRYIAC